MIYLSLLLICLFSIVSLLRSPRRKTPATVEGKRVKGIPRSTFRGTSSLEPSQKWQSLGTSDELYVTAPETPLNTAMSGSVDMQSLM